MIHPHTELRFINEQIGHGVVATQRIPKGTITWARDPLDQNIPLSVYKSYRPAFREEIDKFTWVDESGDRILCWDIARYANHSCTASCLPVGPYDFTFAVRDILPGEELTDDYGTLNLLEPFACACGSPACRKEVGPDDPEMMLETWDASVRAAFTDIRAVTQPLWTFLSVQEKKAVERDLRDPAKLRSIGHQLAAASPPPLLRAALGR